MGFDRPRPWFQASQATIIHANYENLRSSRVTCGDQVWQTAEATDPGKGDPLATYETVLLERRGPVAVLTLNRPDTANTFSRQVMAEMSLACDEIGADDEIRVVIVTGAGERHFSGGADLREAGDVVRGTGKIVMPPRDVALELERVPQPTIAAINGAAMGLGCEIALACDFRIMAEEAKIGLTEILFGGLPGAGGTQRLPRLIGIAKAKELVFLGRRLTAHEALECGLVNEVVPRAQLLERAEALAGELAELADYALRTAKYLINEGVQMSLDQALSLERKLLLTMAAPEERQAAVEAAMVKSETYRNIFAGGKA